MRHKIYREAAKIPALSSGEIDKMASEEILLSNQRQTIEQAKFPLAEAFEK